MVERIDGLGTYNYPGIKANGIRTNNSAISEDYRGVTVNDPYKAGVVYEPSAVSKNSRVNAMETATVRKEQTVKPESGSIIDEEFLEKIKRVFYSAITAVKDFAKRIWEGGEGAAKTEGLEGTTTEMGEEGQSSGERVFTRSSPIVKDSIFMGDEARAKLDILLEQDNRGHLAKNSDILTYYNRSGKITRMDPSDRMKIMRGQFNDIVL
ncbi:MAG: hypothetical protein E7241_07830 [Lachnospiraceae bacterium]|jgi:hypothetical protein|nr:hypothetical protein [Lachnospiraceae bacterium]